MKYKRILLKISGEALAGPAGYGLDGAVLKRVAQEIKEVQAAGIELAIVCGGGTLPDVLLAQPVVQALVDVAERVLDRHAAPAEVLGQLVDHVPARVQPAEPDAT